jgi:transglutaminase-like putative cysteine protease
MVYDRHRSGSTPAVVNPFNVANLEQSPAHFVFKTGNTTFSLLYTPAQPIWISRPGITFTTPADQGKDVIAWHAYPALRGGETYQLDAILNNPNRQQLQEAGTDYPEWVVQKYLQLPKGFSPRVQELAQEITKEAATPYEKSLAITGYLRENITYQETIAEAPRNRDKLEWILFDYKQAYCVYYASADVLMLRSVGIPARMAVGFTQGERDENTYTVRRFNAHAWPEVYFPDIGWVEFEPTAGQAPLDRPLPPQDPTDANDIGPIANPLTEGDLGLTDRDRTEEGLDAPVQEVAPTYTLYYLLPLLIVFAVMAIFLSRRYALHTRVPVLLRTTFERTGIDVPIWVMRWEK